MSKEKEEYKNLDVNAESKNMIYIICSNYIEEIEAQNKEFRLFIEDVLESDASKKYSWIRMKANILKENYKL